MGKKYDEYIEISHQFESVVDIQSDTRNKTLWRDYIVGNEMEELVDKLCQSLGHEAPDSTRHFWIHGSYGTGKTYAAIFVKHLIEESADTIDTFLSKQSRLSAFRNRFAQCKKNGEYLLVWKTACTGITSGEKLLIELEQAIVDALKLKFGDAAYLGANSLIGGIKNRLYDESINWNYVIKHSTLSNDYKTVDQLQADVEDGDMETIQAVATVLREKQYSLVNSTETFHLWLEDIIDGNSLTKTGIFVIWDEFTEYVRNSNDHTILQQLSEFSKSLPFFVMYVVHKSTEMVENMGSSNYQRIFERFHQVEFHVSPDAAFDLIAGSITARNAMEQNWEEEKKLVISRIQKYLPDMSELDESEDLKKSVFRFCPMHPMTIKLLSRVAESFAAAQRTMFRFMKDKVDLGVGFAGYIKKHGPNDRECWLTPDWLWDYFFTRTSDYSDKDTKAADYINHFNESFDIVSGNNEALMVFKTAMLLLAVMSSTRGLTVYGKIRSNGGISATVQCLENCLAGVIDKQRVEDILATLEESKVLLKDETANGMIRLQLPFRGGSSEDFNKSFEKYKGIKTRYQLFSKDGEFSTTIEDIVNNGASKRLKICACCAETLSINNRLEEINNDLSKYPYKLGLLIVIVHNDAQFIAYQETLSSLASNSDSRITIALVKKPFTDEQWTTWLKSYTRWKMAEDAGTSVTASADGYKNEADTFRFKWASEAIGGSITAWNGTTELGNHYGITHLHRTIIDKVLLCLFPYAPEQIIETETAYKTGSDPSVLAGIQRKGGKSPIPDILSTLRSIGVLDLQSIDEVASFSGDSKTEAIVQLANLVRERMRSGQNVSLSELWDELQKPPYGYYNSIASCVILGYVFSFYQDGVYSWTDSAQSSLPLNEVNLKAAILLMCKGNATTDYLSAGTVTFQRFRDYAKVIFNLSDSQIATETSCVQFIRNAITKAGTPFWALKYLPESAFNGGSGYREAALEIIDKIQALIGTEEKREPIMSAVVKLFSGKGKLKKVLAQCFHEKEELTKAFRTFLFSKSKELQEISLKLDIHPDALNDKLCKVMQGAIYTWTEEDVVKQLGFVTKEYLFLSVLNTVMDKDYRSLEDARHDLKNAFNHMRIALDAVEKLKKQWFDTMLLLKSIADSGIVNMPLEEQDNAISKLSEYGKDAMSRLRESKPLLADILESRGIEYTADELDYIYGNLKDLNADTQLGIFDNALEAQINSITYARNRTKLKEIWQMVSGKETVKVWCTAYSLPLQCLVSKAEQSAIRTIIDVQNGTSSLDKDVTNAIQTLNEADSRVFTDDEFMFEAFIKAVGEEYREFLGSDRASLIAKAKLNLGNDMSKWDWHELNEFRKMLQTIKREKARADKLTSVQKKIKNMNEDELRNRVATFLNSHPEYCDDFAN